MPFETIRIEDGEIYVNDMLLKEPYEVVPPKHQGETKLNKDEFFVLGDNRPNSADSHRYGPIHSEQILGIAIPDKLCVP